MKDYRELKRMYRTIREDPFPPRIELAFVNEGGRYTLIYEKVSWTIEGEDRGLRYGENPDQPAAMYRLVNGAVSLGSVEVFADGAWLSSDVELLQSGKHPGKINITDVDSALHILRYLQERPCCVIVKHNNPSGVAVADSLAEAYTRAYFADRIAAFGGAVVLNRTVDRQTAEEIARTYCEVVAAPDYEGEALDLLKTRKNLRIMRISRMENLREFAFRRYIDFTSLLDGGLILQASFASSVRTAEDFFPAVAEHQGMRYEIERKPTEKELEDMLFGWFVETGVTSNSVIYVKDGVTVGIGTGEQDRVGVAMIARDKAYVKMADRLCWQRFGVSWYELDDETKRREIWEEVEEARGGLEGAIMVSDAFFPFRDGVDVGIREGITGVVQPGGSLRDHEVIQACNEAGVTMVFTGQRCFRH
ncbi:phosphoribosylaminoimidazolecarboxamide formyltransferase [Spirochaeta thermophila]|uniref:Phosphoribosylaminoimidazolecarboxamideformyltra nsferase n=1 Tax=Winmispira thermophila (strain ATCC 49972 / DSM 6192 / RI 19.B1) TaxID=665571 RepID=E0RSF4_WINT6|nr:phosphoribosylaminoimidazolecarboxamide formyltransferase [Spirochaeta thermophila]ADN01941.1 phosphoribosylaminoimidazolecarboxamideformyltransferase [Spirochaeta thermophila DSM 6192]